MNIFLLKGTSHSWMQRGIWSLGTAAPLPKAALPACKRFREQAQTISVLVSSKNTSLVWSHRPPRPLLQPEKSGSQTLPGPTTIWSGTWSPQAPPEAPSRPFSTLTTTPRPAPSISMAWSAHWKLTRSAGMSSFCMPARTTPRVLTPPEPSGRPSPLCVRGRGYSHSSTLRIKVSRRGIWIMTPGPCESLSRVGWRCVWRRALARTWASMGSALGLFISCATPRIRPEGLGSSSLSCKGGRFRCRLLMVCFIFFLSFF